MSVRNPFLLEKLATHPNILALNCYRLSQGYVIHRSDPGGPAAWINALSPWHHVFKDTVYATQEILGDAIAVCHLISDTLNVSDSLRLDLQNICHLGEKLEGCDSPVYASHRRHG
jgi:hypothetical protein